MSTLKSITNGYSLKRREKVYMGLGATLVLVAGVIALLSYVIAPIISGSPWVIASSGLHLLAFVVGSLLVLYGIKNLIKSIIIQLDHSYSKFFVYRIARWFLVRFYSIVAFVLSVIFLVWINDSSPGRRGTFKNREENRTVDDMWDLHPQHYYDKDPPPPFS